MGGSGTMPLCGWVLVRKSSKKISGLNSVLGLVVGFNTVCLSWVGFVRCGAFEMDKTARNHTTFKLFVGTIIAVIGNTSNWARTIFVASFITCNTIRRP